MSQRRLNTYGMILSVRDPHGTLRLSSRFHRASILLAVLLLQFPMTISKSAELESPNAQQDIGCDETAEVFELMASKYVNKTVFSERYRVVFFAGVGGTGHHLFQSVVRLCADAGVCRDAPFRRLLWNALRRKSGFWSAGPVPERRLYCGVKSAMYNARSTATADPRDNSFTIDVVNTLEQTGKTGMLSYPNYYRVNANSQPDAKSLAFLGEAIGADVRIVVLIRSPYAQLSSVHRRFGGKTHLSRTIGRFAKTQIRLVRQLKSIDRRFYTCVNFETITKYGQALDRLLRPSDLDLFSFKDALDSVIDPEKIASYEEADPETKTLIRVSYLPTFRFLLELCKNNTLFGKFME